MRLSITHLIRYDYDRDVSFMPHLVYLRPRENPLLHVAGFDFRLSPAATVSWMRDDFDNLPASLRFGGTGRQLEIESHCTVTTADLPPFDFLLRDYAVSFPFEYEPLHRFNLSIYLTPPAAPLRHRLRHWLAQHLPDSPTETVAWLAEVNRVIPAQLHYARREAPGIQTASETLDLGRGTCRDYAVLLIDCARTVGIAARFVSGYQFDSSADPESHGDMHAWVEVFLPGAGWRGLDPTHGVFCDATYVPVAHAVVAESVTPVQGAVGSDAQTTATFTTTVHVRRIEAATA